MKNMGLCNTNQTRHRYPALIPLKRFLILRGMPSIISEQGVKHPTMTNSPSCPTGRACWKKTKPTETCDLFSSWVEVQSLIATKLWNLDSFVLKDEIIEKIDDKLAETVGLGFVTAGIGAKHAFFTSIDIALTDNVAHELKHKDIRNNLNVGISQNQFWTSFQWLCANIQFKWNRF